jgi:hypothetical protein
LGAPSADGGRVYVNIETDKQPCYTEQSGSQLQNQLDNGCHAAQKADRIAGGNSAAIA